MNNHLARVPVAVNQEGTMEIKGEVLSRVGAQNMDTGGFQSSDLDDVEFYWEYDQLDVDAVFRPGIDTPSSPSVFSVSEIGSTAENPILIDKERDKENSPPLPASPVSERPTQPTVWMRNCLFGTGIEIVPD